MRPRRGQKRRRVLSDAYIVSVGRRPPSSSTYFGPGAAEQLALTTWTTSAGVGMIRVRGSYTVYCGTGDEHVVSVDERAHVADIEAGSDPRDAADMLVEFALSEWADPCQEEDGFL